MVSDAVANRPNERELAQNQFTWSQRAERIVLSACFLAGGWALLDSGASFWGSVCLVAALVLPALHLSLTGYQASLPGRLREMEARQTQELKELAGRE